MLGRTSGNRVVCFQSQHPSQLAGYSALTANRAKRRRKPESDAASEGAPPPKQLRLIDCNRRNRCAGKATMDLLVLNMFRDHRGCYMSTLYSIKSSSLACPVIMGSPVDVYLRNSSSILPCILRCSLSTLHVSYIIGMSILGSTALFFFSLVCPHLTFFSLCPPLSFSSHVRPPHFSIFSGILLDTCTTLVVPLMCSFRF